MITDGEVLYHPEPGRPVDLLDLDEPETAPAALVPDRRGAAIRDETR